MPADEGSKPGEVAPTSDIPPAEPPQSPHEAPPVAPAAETLPTEPEISDVGKTSTTGESTEAPVVPVAEAVVEPAATVTEAGTVRPANPVAARVTVAPPAGAALDRVTLQLLLLFGPSVVGLHASYETTTEVTRLRVALLEEPL